MGSNILVVEDEPDILELISYNLSSNGYSVKTAYSAEKAREELNHFSPDLILLDIMLPGITGLEFCKELRQSEQTSRIPVIMLTARDAEEDMIKGLDGGADDYISKPFSPKVLLSRISAVLRRSSSEEGSGSFHLVYGTLKMNTEEHRVELEGVPLDLTVSEYNILRTFMESPGRAFTRQQLIDNIRGQDYAVTDRTIDFQMVGLRRKLGGLGKKIETVRGVGYRLKGEA